MGESKVYKAGGDLDGNLTSYNFIYYYNSSPLFPHFLATLAILFLKFLRIQTPLKFQKKTLNLIENLSDFYIGPPRNFIFILSDPKVYFKALPLVTCKQTGSKLVRIVVTISVSTFWTAHRVH